MPITNPKFGILDEKNDNQYFTRSKYYHNTNLPCCKQASVALLSDFDVVHAISASKFNVASNERLNDYNIIQCDGCDLCLTY